MRIAIDCDDAAIELKNIIRDHVARKGLDIVDLAYSAAHEANYADIGYNLAHKIRDREFDQGILICGTGQGMAIIANKVEGIYAGACHDVYSAERLRKSNNAQILTMGSRVIGPELAKMVVDAWLASDFEGGRSLPKVETIHRLEKQSFHSNEKE